MSRLEPLCMAWHPQALTNGDAIGPPQARRGLHLSAQERTQDPYNLTLVYMPE
jgi:hypothetical protein